MSAATASIADAPRTNLTSRDDSSKRNRSGQPQAQCTPMPLPAQGTQKIIQGNGTNVGTVISLHCPPEFELVGSKLMCVMDTNSTHWVGETYCKPSSPYGDYGFRVAVLASIVSSAIIFLMSVAFITCCLLDCIEDDKRQNDNENESEMWQWEEQAQHQKDSRSRYSHKGRNNNNNNSQEKVMSQWGTCNPAMCDAMRACRCHQHYAAYGPPPPLSALPGFDYRLPLLPQNPESAQISGPPPQYFGPPESQIQGPARPGLMWQTTETVTPARTGSFPGGLSEKSKSRRRLFVSMTDLDDHHEQLQRDAPFLCSDQRMDTELVDRLVLQLNRIYPQILSDKEAHRFRNLGVPTQVRLAELLKHLHGKGAEACHEFYRGLHIHAEDIYSNLPTRVTQREVTDLKGTNNAALYSERHVLSDRGPMFFLSCFSFVVAIAMLYYYKEEETFRCTGPILHCSAARLSKDVLISYSYVGKHKK
ncbi:uncharacterized protein V6R79_009871 [Siganus canaliculatus]